MQAREKTIDHGTLRRLVDAGARVGADVVGAGSGWGVVIHHGRQKQTLTVQRGTPRTFRRFETLAAYLKALGITELRVHTDGFAATASAGKPAGEPADRRRELARERMLRAHQAAAHDEWFREQVGRALAEARSPNAAPPIPHEQAKADMARQRARIAKAGR